jgi:CRP-like cAMP-binding protein
MPMLKKVDILQPLSEEELRLLADDLTLQVFGKGEVVCRQGDTGTAFYIIRSGHLSVRVRGGDGIEAEVATLAPGMYFGEMSLLTGEPRSATVTAQEDCELLCLDRDSFGVLLQENPAIAQAMSEILAARTQGAQELLEKEREATQKVKAVGAESWSHRILEKIRGIFGGRKAGS